IVTARGVNPDPTATALSPVPAAGGTATTVSITGTGFVASSIVRWNGEPRSTTFVSSTVLRALITASDVATAGSAEATAVNPLPGGGASVPLSVTITTPSIKATPFVSGLSLPLEFVQDPTDPATQYVVEQRGRIRRIVSGILQPTDFIDLTDVVSQD